MPLCDISDIATDSSSSSMSDVQLRLCDATSQFEAIVMKFLDAYIRCLESKFSDIVSEGGAAVGFFSFFSFFSSSFLFCSLSVFRLVVAAPIARRTILKRGPSMSLSIAPVAFV